MRRRATSSAPGPWRRRFELKTKPFDPAEYLDSEEAIAAYLADAREGDAGETAHAAEVVVVLHARNNIETSERYTGITFFFELIHGLLRCRVNDTFIRLDSLDDDM